MQYTSANLLVEPESGTDPDLIVEVTPERAGWEYIHFQARRLGPGHTWEFATGEHELAIVPLGGILQIETNHGTWNEVGGRANVFAGPPHALYLPRHTSLRATAQAECEFAVAWVATDQDHPPQFVTPGDTTREIRGGDNVTRQINGILPPGFNCHKLVIVEVYTPGGNWSSYPPHKHDVHREDGEGRLLEADLEEIYYYKLDKPEGYAYQRVYTDEHSPLHQAGTPIDALMLARDNHVVIVPEGYHPVVSAPGYTTYYLNVLAGSAQSLANMDDPRYSWVKDQYSGTDSRIPIYGE